MNLKKIKIIGLFGVFAVSFLAHFIYQWIPCTFTSIFFPVNESIWEHMKLIFTSFILYGIIEYILLTKFKIENNNYCLSLFISSILSIIIYLLIFIPIYYQIGENMIVSIGLEFIVIAFSQFVSYHILKFKQIGITNYISIFLIIISYIVFGYLTYYPPKTDLFFDTKDEKYGINIYNI